MFNLSKEQKQKYARVIVFVTVVGLIMAYVPLLFVPDNQNQTQNQQQGEQVQQSQTREASIVGTLPRENTVATTTPTSTPASPDGFKGVQEEGNQLNELDKLLNQ